MVNYSEQKNAISEVEDFLNLHAPIVGYNVKGAIKVADLYIKPINFSDKKYLENVYNLFIKLEKAGIKTESDIGIFGGRKFNHIEIEGKFGNVKMAAQFCALMHSIGIGKIENFNQEVFLNLIKNNDINTENNFNIKDEVFKKLKEFESLGIYKFEINLKKFRDLEENISQCEFDKRPPSPSVEMLNRMDALVKSGNAVKKNADRGSSFILK